MVLQKDIMHIGRISKKISIYNSNVFSGIEAQLIKEEVNEKVKIQGIDTLGNLVLLDSKEENITINPNFYSYNPINKIFYPK